MHSKTLKFFKPMYNFFNYINHMIAAFIACTTPYPVSFLISKSLAWFWWIACKNVQNVKTNVSNVLNLDINDPLITSVSKNIYFEFSKNIVDFLKNGIISSGQFKRNIKLDGVGYLKKALEDGKGAVIFTAHIGNFEWGASRIGAEGFKIWGVGLYRENRFLDNYFEKNRKSKYLNTLNAAKMLGVFRILKNNEVVAIPTDWDPYGNAKTYEFFGKKAILPSGAVQIALATGAPLLPSFITRNKKYHHHQVICEPLELIREGKNREDLIEKNMQTVIKVLEKYIRENIGQWVMFHDIWVKD